MKTTPRPSLRQLVTIGVVLALAVVAAWAGERPPWKALSASGPVNRTAPEDTEGPWVAVRRGDLIEPLSLLRTGKRGRAALSQRSSVLIVDPQSELRLPEGGAFQGVRQDRGSVVYDIASEPGRRFTVETPYLVAGVKGTVFGVMVTERYALVSVEHGVVEVRDPEGERSAELRAGDAVMVDAIDHRLEHIRRGDARDRERGHTPRTRDRMQLRLRDVAQVADRRWDDRRTRGEEDDRRASRNPDDTTRRSDSGALEDGHGDLADESKTLDDVDDPPLDDMLLDELEDDAMQEAREVQDAQDARDDLDDVDTRDNGQGNGSS